MFSEVQTCQSSFGKSPVLYQNNNMGEYAPAVKLLPLQSCFPLCERLFSFIYVCFCHSGFGQDREPHLYYDDACVVPERLEGKKEYRN